MGGGGGGGSLKGRLNREGVEGVGLIERLRYPKSNIAIRIGNMANHLVLKGQCQDDFPSFQWVANLLNLHLSNTLLIK